MEGQHRYWNDILKWLLAQQGDALVHARKAELSFEWIKVRFVIEGSKDNHPELVQLGRQILAAQPNDFQAMRVLSFQLGTIRTDKDTREGIKLCHIGIAKWPTSPTFYVLEGYTYETRWLGLGKRREDAELTIKSTQQAISKLPSGAYLEAPLKRRVQFMMDKLASRA